MPISAGPRSASSPCAGQICASLHFTAGFRDQGRPVVRVATIMPWPSRPGLSARTWARNATTTCRGWDRFCRGRAILVRAMHSARFSTRCGGRPAALRKESISYCSLRPRPGVKVQALQPEWLTSRLDTWFVGHTDPWRGHRRPVSSQARSIPPPTRGPHPVRSDRGLTPPRSPPSGQTLTLSFALLQMSSRYLREVISVKPVYTRTYDDWCSRDHYFHKSLVSRELRKWAKDKLSIYMESSTSSLTLVPIDRQVWMLMLLFRK